jgi:hypothetical protein
MPRTVGAAGLALTASLLVWTPVSGSSTQGDLSLHIRIDGAMVAQPSGYEVLGEPSHLILEVWITNGSDTESVVLPAQFEQYVRIRLMREEGSRGAVASRSAYRLFSEDPVGNGVLLPGQGVKVIVKLVPSAGQTFQLGQYAVQLDATQLGERVTAADGTEWVSRFPLRAIVPLRVTAAKTHAEAIKEGGFRAKSYLLRGDLASAHAEYERLTVMAPESPAGPLGLGHVELRRGAFTTAVRWFEAALQLEARAESSTWQSLAYAYVGAGQEERAREVLMRVVPVDAIPDRMRVLRQRAAAQRRDAR